MTGDNDGVEEDSWLLSTDTCSGTGVHSSDLEHIILLFVFVWR